MKGAREGKGGGREGERMEGEGSEGRGELKGELYVWRREGRESSNTWVNQATPFRYNIVTST